MRHSRFIRCTVATLSLGIACSRAGTPAEQRAARAALGRGDIVVAVVWPWQARPDIFFREGLRLAVDETNGPGGAGVAGRRIRVREEDDRESVNEGLLIAQRIANDPEIIAVIGHLQSYVAVPAAAIYDMAGLVYISPTATTAELTTKGYSRVFRTTFVDEQVGHQMAEYAARHGYRRVGIYYLRSAYGRALANAFEERAITHAVSIVARASYEPGQLAGENFDLTFQEWKQLDLDAVFVAGQAPEAGTLIAEARRDGILAPMLGSDAMGVPSLITAGGQAVEGTVIPVAFHPAARSASAERFVRAFQARYGKEPDIGAAMAYDALTVLAQAIRTASSPTPGEIARAMHAIRRWPGVLGELTFDRNGDLVDPRILKTVIRGGRFEYLDDPVRVRAAGEPGGGR